MCMEKNVKITVEDVCPLVDEISVKSAHLDADGIKQSKLAYDLGFDSFDFVRLVQGIEQLPKMRGFVIDEKVGTDLRLNMNMREFLEAVNKNISVHP